MRTGPRHHFWRVALVEVQSAEEEQDGGVVPEADSKPAVVAGNGRRHEAGNFVERHRGGFAEGGGHAAESGAEDDRGLAGPGRGRRGRTRRTRRSLRSRRVCHDSASRPPPAISANICLVRTAQPMNCAAASIPSRSGIHDHVVAGRVVGSRPRVRARKLGTPFVAGFHLGGRLLADSAAATGRSRRRAIPAGRRPGHERSSPAAAGTRPRGRRSPRRRGPRPRAATRSSRPCPGRRVSVLVALKSAKCASAHAVAASGTSARNWLAGRFVLHEVVERVVVEHLPAEQFADLPRDRPAAGPGLAADGDGQPARAGRAGGGRRQPRRGSRGRGGDVGEIGRLDRSASVNSQPHTSSRYSDRANSHIPRTVSRRSRRPAPPTRSCEETACGTSSISAG